MTKQSRRGSRRVTISDVAKRAGVSSMTVSRVINQDPRVTDKTRAAIQAAVAELKYTPNPVARRLAKSDGFRIGLLYSNPSAAYLSELLLGALDESSKTGHQLVVEKCGATPAAEKAALDKLLQGGVAGVILPPPLCEARLVLDQLRQFGIAAVAVAPGMPSGEFPTVRMDNHKAAYEMTERLLALGHRNIAFIKGHPNQSVSGIRLQGFREALRRAGMDPATVRVEQGHFSYRSGLLAAERLLARTPRPSAIFAANDDMAAAAIAVAHRLGIKVPEQLSICGFDDTLIASTLWPALTTVHQPIAAMGRAAVGLLLDEMQRNGETRQQPPRQLLLRHRLVLRDSTAAPAP